MQMATIGGGSATLPHAWGGSRLRALPSPLLEHPPGELPERDLPLPMQRACARIHYWRAGPFEFLASRDRAVLAEIVRCIDRKRPQSAVHVRRDTLAVREGCSVPTITRALARLVSLGWIRRDQVKSRARGFQVGSVELTPEAIAWLGLLEPSSALRESPVIDASIDSSIQCIHRQPPAGGLLDKSREKTRPGALPSSLSWLEQLHVSRNGVFLLMKLARKRGVLLETVANLCKEQIQAARMPFAYLRDLLSLDKDWQHIAQVAQGQDSMRQSEEAREAGRAARQARLGSASGRWWLAPTKRQLLRVEGGVFMAYALDDAGRLGRVVGAVPDVDPVLDAIDAKRLVAW